MRDTFAFLKRSCNCSEGLCSCCIRTKSARIVVATFVKTCHQQLAEVETSLKAALVKAKVIHQDETKLRVGKSGWWVHVCSTDQLTHYAAHPSRGRKALDAIGIAPQFRGTSVHDGLTSYQGYRFTQAWRNVHRLRELTFVEEELQQAC